MRSCKMLNVRGYGVAALVTMVGHIFGLDNLVRALKITEFTSQKFTMRETQ